jgi:hypothetical protein
MTTLLDKLKAAGLKFQVNGPMAAGVFETEDNRSHVFSIHIPGEDWGGVHEHDVVFKIGKLKSNNELQLLCSLADRFQRGGIAVNNGEAFLKVELPTDLPGEIWVKQLKELSQLADLLEQILDPINDDN